MNTCDECDGVFFDYGDQVRLTSNHHVSGQVIGERSWGREYQVRLIGVLQPVWYEFIELEPDPEFDKGGSAAKPPADAPSADIIDLAAVRAAGRA